MIKLALFGRKKQKIEFHKKLAYTDWSLYVTFPPLIEICSYLMITTIMQKNPSERSHQLGIKRAHDQIVQIIKRDRTHLVLMTCLTTLSIIKRHKLKHFG